jgi:hypothetical protein
MITIRALRPTCTIGRGPRGRCSAHTRQARTFTSNSSRSTGSASDAGDSDPTVTRSPADRRTQRRPHPHQLRARHSGRLESHPRRATVADLGAPNSLNQTSQCCPAWHRATCTSDRFKSAAANHADSDLVRLLADDATFEPQIGTSAVRNIDAAVAAHRRIERQTYDRLAGRPSRPTRSRELDAGNHSKVISGGAWRSVLGRDAFDAGADRAETADQVVVPAIDVVHPGDRGLTLGSEAGHDHRRAGADVVSLHLGA